MKRGVFFLLQMVVIIPALAFTGCQQSGHQQRYSEARSLMTTIVQLDVCHNGRQSAQMEAAYADAWKRLDEIAWRMSPYDPKSDLSRLNTSSGIPVKIGADTYALMKRAAHFYKLTGGVFDMTVWPLISLWKDAQKTQSKPSEEKLQDVMRQSGPDKLIFLPDNQVGRKNDVVQVDLGGIAKGYSADEVARIFRAHGLENFYIAIGGDVYVGGKNCEGNLWRIGIRDPRDKQGKIYDVVLLTNAAVSTSGDYERYVVIDGERYSHIIDPRTGYPEKTVVSASVIAPTSEEADALSTAVDVLGHDEGIPLIESLGDGYAALMLERHVDQKAIQQFQTKSYERLQLSK